MMLSSAAHNALAALASGGGEHSGDHDPALPFITGGGSLLALLLLLWITTRFNRDR